MDDIRNNYSVEDDGSIELWPLVQALLRKWWLIALAGIVVGAVVLVGTLLLVTPQYRSGFTAYVNNRSETDTQTVLSNADLSAARYLTYTYTQIIRSRSVLEAAADRVGLDENYSDLGDMVSTSILSDTEIISVDVLCEEPSMSKAYAEAIAEVARKELSEIVEGSSMQIIDEPVLPTKIAEPSYTKNALIGALLGVFLAAAGIVLRTVLDDRVKGEEALEARFGLPILGSVPNTASAAHVGGNYYGYGAVRSSGGKK